MASYIPNNPESPAIITYRTMRLIIGVLAISLPFILLAGSLLFGGCHRVLGSISAYYHTDMRNVFVGVLCAVALFLFSYKGYAREDFLLCKFASLYALGIAFCPTEIKSESLDCMNLPLRTNAIISGFHYFFAAGFFVITAAISIGVFTLNRNGTWRTKKPRKQSRNRVHITCGAAIMACLVLIPLYDFVLRGLLPPLPFSPIFWLESAALVFFGTSWLVKGGAVPSLNDPPEEEAAAPAGEQRIDSGAGRP